MSWQSYVDAICNDPNITRAAILTRADGGYVASTEGFYVSAEGHILTRAPIARDFLFRSLSQPTAHEDTTESAILAAVGACAHFQCLPRSD